MTDFTRSFIPVTSDSANARMFCETVQTGSPDAARLAREDACRHVFAGPPPHLIHTARLWAEMREDMRAVIDVSRAQRGYVDVSDLTGAGYSLKAIEAYLRSENTGRGANEDTA